MKTYSIPDVGNISVPDHVTQDMVMDKLKNDPGFRDRLIPYGQQAQQPTMAQPPQMDNYKLPTNLPGYTPSYQDLGLGTIASNALHRGIAGLGTTVEQLGALGAGALGFDDTSKRWLKGAAESQARTEAQYPTAYKGVTDIRPGHWPGDLLGYGTEQAVGALPDLAAIIGTGGVGEALAVGALPDLAAIIGTGGVGEVLAKKVATAGAERLAAKAGAEAAAKTVAEKEAAAQALQKTAGRGQLAGMFAGATAMDAPSTYQDIYDKTGQLDPGVSMLLGAAQGVLDSVVPGTILKNLTGTVRDKLAVELISRSDIVPPSYKAALAKHVGITALEGGVAQGAKQALTILGEQTAGAQGNMFDPDNIGRMLEAAAGGATGAALLGAIPGHVAARRDIAEANAKAAAPGAAPTDTAEAPTPTDRVPNRNGPPGMPAVVPPAAGPNFTMKPLEGEVLPPEAPPGQAALPAPTGDTGTAALPQPGGTPLLNAPASHAQPEQLFTYPNFYTDAAGTTTKAQPDLFGQVTPPPPSGPGGGGGVSAPGTHPATGHPGFTPPHAPVQGDILSTLAELVSQHQANKQAAEGTVQPPGWQTPGHRAAPEPVEGGTVAPPPFREPGAPVGKTQAGESEPVQPPTWHVMDETVPRGDVSRETAPAPEAAPVKTGTAEIPTQEKTTAGTETAASLYDKLGIPKQAPVRKIQDTESPEAVAKLQELANNQKIPAKTRENIRNHLKSREPTDEAAPASKEVADVNSAQPEAADQTTTGTRPAVPVGPDTGESSGRTEPPGNVRLGADLQPAEAAAPRAADVQPAVRRVYRFENGTDQYGTPQIVHVESRPELHGDTAAYIDKAYTPTSPVEYTDLTPKQLADYRASLSEPQPEKPQHPGMARLQETVAPKATKPLTPEEARVQEILQNIKNFRAEQGTLLDNRGKRPTAGTPERARVDAISQKIEALKKQAEDVVNARTQQNMAEQSRPVDAQVARTKDDHLTDLLNERRALGKPEPGTPEHDRRVELSKEIEREGGMSEAAEEFFRNLHDNGLITNIPASAPDLRRVGFVRELPPNRLKGTTAVGAKEAQIYFSKVPLDRMMDALRFIAHDVVMGNEARSTKDTEVLKGSEADFFKGTSKQAAEKAVQWVNKNLTPEARDFLAKQIDGFQRADELGKRQFEQKEDVTTSATDTAKEKLQAQREAEEKRQEEEDKQGLGGATKFDKELLKALHEATDRWTEEGHDPFDDPDLASLTARGGELELKYANPLSRPLHPEVANALRDGNVARAIRLLAGTHDALKNFARLSGIVDHVKSVVRDNLINDKGERVAGYFDPKTNTIYLDSKTGLNNHAVLHELTHAATSHILDNPSHPVTRQLTKLFEAVRDSLGSEYGVTNLHEFVAEAFSNPEFQQMLSMMPADSTKTMSAWERLTTSVANFIRSVIGKPKSSESVFDKTDRLINEILSPSPEFRDASALNLAVTHPEGSEAKGALRSLLEMGEGTLYSPRTTAKVHEFFNRYMPNTAKSFTLSALPLHAVTDLASHVLPSANVVNRLIREKMGDLHMRMGLAQTTIDRMDKYMKGATPEQIEAFKNLYYKSTASKSDDETRQGVNPFRNRTDYASHPELMKVWDDLQHHMTQAGPEGAGLYREMLDYYTKQKDDIIKAMYRRLDSSDELTSDQKLSIKNAMAEELEKKSIDPYLPLTRHGDYWLAYDSNGVGGERHVHAFETELERQRHIEEVQRDFAARGIHDAPINKFSKVSEMRFNDTASNRTINHVLETLNKSKDATDELKQEIMEAFLRLAPESSMVKQFQFRKGTAGFSEDFARAFRERSRGAAMQLNNMIYGGKLSDIRTQLRAEASQLGQDPVPIKLQTLNRQDKKALLDYFGATDINDPTLIKMVQNRVNDLQKDRKEPDAFTPLAKKLRDTDNKTATGYSSELEKRIAFALKPEKNPMASQINSAGFHYLLGYNIASALNNLTHLPMIVAPYLAGEHGWANAMREIQDAYSVHFQSGTSKNKMFSLDNFNFDDPNLDPKIRQLKTLAEEALKQGQLNRTSLHENPLKGGDSGTSLFDRVTHGSGWMFEQGERMNRIVSMIAAYRLELARMAKDPEFQGMDQLTRERAAANKAIDTAELVRGSHSAAAAPRISQSGLGKVLYLFKRYGASMNYLMYRVAKDIPSDDPMVRKMALKRTIGALGTSALFAGVQGLPLYGVAAMVYNMFKDPDDTDFNTHVREAMGEGMFKGALNQATGSEIASRVGLSDLMFKDNKTSSGNASLAEEAMSTLFGVPYGMIMKAVRGTKEIQQGQVERGVEQMMPSAVGNVMRAYRYSQEGVKTLRGDTVVSKDDVDGRQIIGQLIGYAPANVVKQEEINAQMKGIDDDIIKRQKELLNLHNIAKRQGDTEMEQEWQKELMDLSEKHGLGITQKTLDTSWKTFLNQSKVMEKYHGIAVPPKLMHETDEREAAAQ